MPPVALTSLVPPTTRPELAGADVLIAGCPGEVSRELVGQLGRAGARIAGLGLDPLGDGPERCLDADIFDSTSVDRAISSLVEEVGKLDALVCAYPDPESYPGDAIFNLLGATAPYLRDARGSIVLAVSRDRRGDARKHHGFTQVLSRELSYFGIRVNLVLYDTCSPSHVAQRVPEAEDVANAVLFLASPRSVRISGQVLRLEAEQLY